MRLLDRRRGMGSKAQVVDPYEGCITMEFTETFENFPRTLTANHNNVLTYLEKLIVDGIEQPIQKSYQYTFGLGTHKIGWKLNTTVVYPNIFTATSGYNGGKYSADQALITIPEQITEIKSTAMRGVPAYHPMSGVICYVKTPPIAEMLSIANWYINPVNPLRVPANSVEAYKVATGWSQYANNIIAI